MRQHDGRTGKSPVQCPDRTVPPGRLAFLVLLLAAVGWTGEIRQSVDFCLSDLSFREQASYTVPTLRGAVSTAEIGRPLMPLVSLNVLIPPTAEVRSVEVVSSRQTLIDGSYRVFPRQLSAPTDDRQAASGFVPPDPAVYSSDAAYPGRLAEIVPSGSQCGYRIAGVLLYPLQYNPLSGKLTLYTRLDLRIEYEEGKYPAQAITPSQAEQFGSKVRAMVLNPDAAVEFAPPAAARDGEVDYAIITPARLTSAWTPLIELRRRQGMNTIVMPVESIYARYPGADPAAQVREFIRDYWRNRGLKWVVLGGQHDLLPVRYCERTPADLYFACLDGSWDSNHNGRYGEFGAHDTVDLLADVFVGRIPCDSAADIAAYINKDTIYELHPDTNYLKKILLPWMAFDESWSGSVGCENVKAVMPRDWLADVDSVKPNLIRDSLNAGYHFLYYNGHASPIDLGYTFSIQDIPNLYNVDSHRPSIISSIGCSCGRFDSADCIAAALINAVHGGAVATILNARYGLYCPGAMSEGELFAIEFYRQYQTCTHIGVAQSNVKDRFASLARNQNEYRWEDYVLTSFFDPALPLWTQPPRILSVSLPESLPAGPQIVPVEVNWAGTGVRGAVVTLLNQGRVVATGQTNSQGGIELPADANPGDTLEVWVFARDFLPVSGRIAVRAPHAVPAIVLRRVFVDDSANNRLDPGETARVCVTLGNGGSSPATGLVGTLRTVCRYVLLLDSVSAYGTVEPGDSSVGAFRVMVAPDCPEGTTAEFWLDARSNEGAWRPCFEAVIGPERLRGACWATLDTGGFLLSVTGFGAIGTTRHWGEGLGFVWPRDWGTTRLALASLAIGADSGYVCDWFYRPDYPSNDTDFVMVDSIRPVIPPERADQEFIATYSDAGMGSSRGLLVTQRSLAFARRGFTDFAILEYRITNTSPVSSGPLAVGLFADICICGSIGDTLDFARADSGRRLVYGTNFEDAFVGLNLLSPDRLLGLSAIDGPTYVQAPGMMSEAVKDSFLWGRKKVMNGMHREDWSQVVSAGPFTILPGMSQIVAFAVVAGHTPTELYAHCDTARNWYAHHPGIVEDADSPVLRHSGFKVSPLVFRRSLTISYPVPPDRHLRISAYDPTGRLVERIFDGRVTAPGQRVWEPGPGRDGVYILKINEATTKVVRIRG